MSDSFRLHPAAVSARARRLGRAGFACGRSGIMLLVLGLAFVVPAFVDARFVAAMFVWDALVLVGWLVDLRRLPAPDELTVCRTWLAPSELSVESTVELALHNASGRPIAAQVLDTVPHQLRTAPPACRLEVRPHADSRARYLICPTRRGGTSVGAVYLRYHSPLRLAERWASADLSQTIVTYPNLAEAKRHSIYLIRSRQIELEKRSTRVRGAGRAFESLREYRDGDDVRDICWTASARRGKPVTRVYEIERSQTVWVVLDSGRLMRARVAGLSKLDYAVNATLALAQVVLDSGDQVGLLAYGRRIAQRLPAARGAAHLMRLVEQLAAVQEDESEADHLLAASRVLTDQKRRGLIVWITDLAETAMTPEVVRAAAHLMSRHVVLCLVIGEPDLHALALRNPDDLHAMYETAAAQEVAHRREVLLAKLRHRGALALESSAAGLPLAAINAYLDIKQRNRL